MSPYESTQGQRHLVFWRDKLDDPSFVYVIGIDGDSAIKVGHTNDLMHRLQAGQTWGPRRMSILHCIPGNRQLEAACHKRLEGSRVPHGGIEWFDGPDVPEFLTWIEGVADLMVANHNGSGVAPGITEHTPIDESEADRVDRESRWRRIGELWKERGITKNEIRLAVDLTEDQFEVDILRMRSEAGYELDEDAIAPRRLAPSRRLPNTAYGNLNSPAGGNRYRTGLRPIVRKVEPNPVTVRFVKPDPVPEPLTWAQRQMCRALDITEDQWRARYCKSDSEAA